MGTEIERKFLVQHGIWRPAGEGTRIRQGYLSSAKQRIVRVRAAGSHAFLTIKGPTEDSTTRLEFEYPIPPDDAAVLLGRLCEPRLLEKTRYVEKVGSHLWEIDVFEGDNDGLILAEIELDDPGEPFERPAWIGKEVTDDPRYLNVNLAHDPFSRWGKPSGENATNAAGA
jgi:adenylate cyclase